MGGARAFVFVYQQHLGSASRPAAPHPESGGQPHPAFPWLPLRGHRSPWVAATRDCRKEPLLRFPPSAVSNAAFRGHIRRVCGTLHPQTLQTTPSPRLKIYVKGFSPAELEPALPRCPEGPGCVLDLST